MDYGTDIEAEDCYGERAMDRIFRNMRDPVKEGFSFLLESGSKKYEAPITDNFKP